MNARLDFYKTSPDIFKGLLELENLVSKCGLELSLLNLIKLKASLINGCAFCVDMHTKDAIKSGENTQRLFAVAVWRETPFFTERERAALAWTEALTLISETHAPDDVYQELMKHFNEKEATDLTFAITTINSWNRLAIGFRKLPK